MYMGLYGVNGWWGLIYFDGSYFDGCIWRVSWNGGFPQQPWVFLLKMISTWGVKWGYHHLRKHPYSAPDGSEARKVTKLTGRLDIARRLKTRHLKGQPLFLLSKNDPATKIKLSSYLKWKRVRTEEPTYRETGKLPRICNQNKQPWPLTLTKLHLKWGWGHYRLLRLNMAIITPQHPVNANSVDPKFSNPPWAHQEPAPTWSHPSSQLSANADVN